MNRLTPREHARLARELIDACGGVGEAARACRVGKSTLSTYQNPHEAATMPADVMDALQVYANRGPIYSEALSEGHGSVAATGCLKELACDLAQQSVDVMATVRAALADGRLSPRELDSIAEAEREAEAALDKLRALRRSMEAATPTPLRVA